MIIHGIPGLWGATVTDSVEEEAYVAVFRSSFNDGVGGATPFVFESTVDIGSLTTVDRGEDNDVADEAFDNDKFFNARETSDNVTFKLLPWLLRPPRTAGPFCPVVVTRLSSTKNGGAGFFNF